MSKVLFGNLPKTIQLCNFLAGLLVEKYGRFSLWLRRNFHGSITFSKKSSRQLVMWSFGWVQQSNIGVWAEANFHRGGNTCQSTISWKWWRSYWRCWPSCRRPWNRVWASTRGAWTHCCSPTSPFWLIFNCKCLHGQHEQARTREHTDGGTTGTHTNANTSIGHKYKHNHNHKPKKKVPLEVHVSTALFHRNHLMHTRASLTYAEMKIFWARTEYHFECYITADAHIHWLIWTWM